MNARLDRTNKFPIRRTVVSVIETFEPQLFQTPIQRFTQVIYY